MDRRVIIKTKVGTELKALSKKKIFLFSKR